MGFQFIDRQPQLEQAVATILQQDAVAVDTESSSFYTYESELCLIQISSRGNHFIIDALAKLNWDGLGEVFENEAITKVMHTAASDITELRRIQSFKFNNLFDVMVGCRMLAFPSCSLVSLVKHYTGKDLEKTEQKSNWKKRPLSASQLEYAHRDTIYLEEIWSRMENELKQFKFLEEFNQDMNRIIKESFPVERVYDPDSWKWISGSMRLPPARRGFLKALLELREARARKENIAPFRLGSNDGLLRIAERSPDSVAELYEMGLHPDFVKKDGDKILDARNRAPEIRNSDVPRESRRAPDQLMGILKKWRKDVADYRGFDTSIILSNRQLEQIVDARPAHMEDLKAMDLMSDWKLANYGPMILEILAGKNPAMPAHLSRIPPEKRRVEF
ncbi:MAG: HRDC domain-containing protein [Leptospirales bacterium]|nr:HRDC domain-containing protein [Leptospirales bacterium]